MTRNKTIGPAWDWSRFSTTNASRGAHLIKDRHRQANVVCVGCFINGICLDIKGSIYFKTFYNFLSKYNFRNFFFFRITKKKKICAFKRYFRIYKKIKNKMSLFPWKWEGKQKVKSNKQTNQTDPLDCLIWFEWELDKSLTV